MWIICQWYRTDFPPICMGSYEVASVKPLRVDLANFKTTSTNFLFHKYFIMQHFWPFYLIMLSSRRFRWRWVMNATRTTLSLIIGQVWVTQSSLVNIKKIKKQHLFLFISLTDGQFDVDDKSMKFKKIMSMCIWFR